MMLQTSISLNKLKCKKLQIIRYCCLDPDNKTDHEVLSKYPWEAAPLHPLVLGSKTNIYTAIHNQLRGYQSSL